jgi:hypothetical protein
MAVDDSHLRQVGEIVFGSGTNGMGVRKCVLCVCCVCVVCVLFQREGQRASGGRGRDRKGGNGWRSCSFFFFGPLSHPHAPSCHRLSASLLIPVPSVQPDHHHANPRGGCLCLLVAIPPFPQPTSYVQQQLCHRFWARQSVRGKGT